MQEYSVGNMEGTQGLEHSSSFEAQFKNRQELKTASGTFKFVDIKPAGVVEGSPIVFIPGWSITLNTQRQLLEDLHNSGQHIVSLEFPRFGGKVQKQENMPREVVRQAEMIGELINLHPEEKIDVVAQSMGAMDLIAAIKLYPELLDRINRVVLISPAGLAGNDNFFKLLSRFPLHLAQDLTTALRSPDSRGNILRMIGQSSLYINTNPLRAIAGEATAIAGSDIYEGLKDFQNAGKKIGIIQGRRDRLTPAKKLWDKIGEGSEMQIVKSNETPSGFKYEPKDNQIPPVNVATEFHGGHDNRVYGEPGFARKIVKQLEFLAA